MKRREFLVALGCAISWPAVLTAQQPGKVASGHGLADNIPAGPTLGRPLRDRMSELGWDEGRNYVIHAREFGTDRDLAMAGIDDLIRAKVDVVVVLSEQLALAIHARAPTLPVVVVAARDPVELGAAMSLARPGKMITGLTMMVPELTAKRVEFPKEIMPRSSRLAVFSNPQTDSESEIETTLAAAQTLQLEARVFPARQQGDMEQALDAAKEWKADAGLVLENPLFFLNRMEFAAAAVHRQIPLACPFRDMAQAGCLFAYSVPLAERFQRAAVYIDKILKGTNAGELPFEQPTRFELVFNLAKARALGLQVSPRTLARADDVIE